MKKLVLVAILALIAGCSSEVNTSTASQESAVTGTYFSKKKQTRVIIHAEKNGSLLMDTISLNGETKDVPLKKMSDDEIKAFFSGSSSEIKKGDYFATSDAQCSSVFIKYPDDVDGYVANCMVTSPSRYVKE